MLIKKKDYTYKITLYPANNQNSTLNPVKFSLGMDNVEIKFSQRPLTYTYTMIQVPDPSEYKIILKNIKDSIAIKIISLVSKAFNYSWGKIPERINLEIKRRSEIISVYNVMVKTDFTYYNTLTCNFEFSGEYANCTYLC
jgi:hypothetical protein